VTTNSSSLQMNRSNLSKQQKKEWLIALVFLAPSLLGFLVFIFAPVMGGFFLSFTEWDMLTPPKWIGLNNYITIFKADPLFWLSLKNTLLYSAMVILLGIPISLGLALAVNSKLKGINFFRTIYFIPVVVSTVAAGLVWKWILQPDLGPVNTLLRLLGIKSISWLGDPKTALLSVAIVAIWLGMGYNMVILLAGLKGIPSHLYEAAAMDGAVGIQQFWYITLPLLTPSLFFVLVMSIIGSFQVFSQVFVMTTNAGPGNATLVYVYYLWENAFRWFKMGYASALAYILFLLIMAVTFIQLKFMGGRVTYELD
jgi:multiple sugar transport system permease protein